MSINSSAQLHFFSSKENLSVLSTLTSRFPSMDFIGIKHFSVHRFLQLGLYLSCLWMQSGGQTCTSYGGGSCSRSKPCKADHPFEDVECASNPVFRPFPSSPLPTGVTRCPFRRWGEVVRCEYSAGEKSNELATSSGNITLSVELNSIDYDYFAVNVSWNISYDYSGGYEVRVKKDGWLTGCFCVNNPDIKSLYMNDQLAFPPFGYNPMREKIDVEVILLTDALPRNSSSASMEGKWPGSCLDVNHDDTTCGLPIYGPPSDVTVTQHFSRPDKVVLDVSWHYETKFVLPAVYYVEVYNIHKIFDYFTIIVKNATGVLISYLDPSVQYGVRVQPYVHCSGLANRSYGLGCGLWSRAVTPVISHMKPSKITHIRN